MPCMCGDTHCWSCGPAQGNTRCIICNAWADDGCEHIDADTGQLKPEYVHEAMRIIEKERADDLERDKERLEEEAEYVNTFCDDCWHPWSQHGEGGCTYERGDHYESGYAPMALGPCNCQAKKPVTALTTKETYGQRRQIDSSAEVR